MCIPISPNKFRFFLHLSIIFVAALFLTIIIHELGHILAASLLGIRTTFNLISTTVYTSNPILIAQTGAGGNVATLVAAIIACGVTQVLPSRKRWKLHQHFCIILAGTCFLLTGVNIATNYWS